MALLSRASLVLFASGDLSGTQVFDLISAAWDDGWGRGDTLAEMLVHAGRGGLRRCDIAGDIVKAADAAGLVCNTCHPYSVTLRTGGELGVYLPHEIYAGVAAETPLAELCFNQDDLAATSGLPHMLKTWAAHADVQHDGDLTAVAALGFHADGVQYSSSMRAGGAKSIVAASMNVISAPSRKQRHRRQPLFVVSKHRICQCGCGGFHTYQDIMEVMAWSFGCLASGRAPSCRHDGSAWQQDEVGRRIGDDINIPQAAFLQVRGDWESFEQLFRVRSVNSDKFCWMCEATQTTLGPLHYHNFLPDAVHRTTLISHADYWTWCVHHGVEPSHFFRIPGFSLDMLAVDAMHTCDLGTFQDAAGSLFFLEIDNKRHHRNRNDGLKWLNRSLKSFYTAHGDEGLSSLAPLTLPQIIGKSLGYPFLKAKAAQTRHAAKFCLMLAQQHQSGTADRRPFQFERNHRLLARSAEHRNLVVEVFAGMTEFIGTCAADVFVPGDCRRGAYKYLQNLQTLNKMWRPPPRFCKTEEKGTVQAEAKGPHHGAPR